LADGEAQFSRISLGGGRDVFLQFAAAADAAVILLRCCCKKSVSARQLVSSSAKAKLNTEEPKEKQGYPIVKVHDFRVAWFWNFRLNTRLE
jgi:hypothetical protein